jgi:hypothetical protein
MANSIASSHSVPTETVFAPPSFSAFRTLRESIASESFRASDSDGSYAETETAIEIFEVPRSKVFFGTALFQDEPWPWLWYIWRPVSPWNVNRQEYPISVPRGQHMFLALAGFLNRSGLPAGLLDMSEPAWRAVRGNFMDGYNYADKRLKHIPPYSRGTAWRMPLSTLKPHREFSGCHISEPSSHSFNNGNSAKSLLDLELVSVWTWDLNRVSPLSSGLGWGILIPAEAEFLTSQQGFDTALELFTSGSPHQRQVYGLDFSYYCERRGLRPCEALCHFRDLLYTEYASTILRHYLSLPGESPRFAAEGPERTMVLDGADARRLRTR